jgi:3-methylcrotonyl-CoA carboxylase alpha subunit
VDNAADFEAALEGAKREAVAAFGDARVLIEKYILSPRHIEVQVFADMHGNAIHLGERDCSLQRRHQKVIEEAPASGLTREVRAAMGEAAVRAARAAGYVGAGTIEFIADGKDKIRTDGFWFMEMNTRLQVEHPVTEAVTGLDLVELQFRVAAGEKLPLTQKQVTFDGHAIEARIYAEDPAHRFLPSTGKLIALEFPEGVRVDAGVETGDEISPFYDPLIAKMIARGTTRAQAMARLAEALDRTVVAGPRNNVNFLAALCRAEEFRVGRFDTGFIERNLHRLIPSEIDRAAAARGTLQLLAQEQARIAMSLDRNPDAPASPWDAADGFDLTGPRTLTVPIVADGEVLDATVSFEADGLSVVVDGVPPALDARVFEATDGVRVLRHGRQTIVRRPDYFARDLGHNDGDGSVNAPMHGRVLALFVAAGDKVARGQRLAIVEAMKMEHTLTAPFAGTVAMIMVSAGVQVSEGACLLTIVPEEDSDAS